MTPNFAFSLSQDNLRLFIKVKGGWALLGTVPGNAPNVAEQLAQLREEARRRAPGGMATKLLVPNDYIRYLELPAEAPHETVQAELATATPYSIAELVYDIERRESATHVAAVAKEFLEEADKFALDHGLAPVCYVANPREGTFTREIYFGPTSGAGRLIEKPGALGPDKEPMTIVALPPHQTASVKTESQENADARPIAEDLEPETSAPSDDGPQSVAVTPPPKPAKSQPPPASPGAKPTLAAQKAPPKPVSPNPAGGKKSADPGTDTPKEPPHRESDKMGKATFGAAGDKPVKSGKSGVSGKAIPGNAPRPGLGAGTARPAGGLMGKASADELPFNPMPGMPQPGFLTRIGGTRFAQVVIGLLAAVLLLGLGYALLSQGAPEERLVRQSDGGGPVTERVILDNPFPATAPPPAVSAPVPSGSGAENERALTPPPASARVLTPEEARRNYASTGVWQKAPTPPAPLRIAAATENAPVQMPPLKRRTPAEPALGAGDVRTDAALPPPPAPPPPGSDFVLNEDGYVIPSPEGTLAPGGVLVFAGAPKPAPRARPGSSTPTVVQPEFSANGTPLIGRPPTLPPQRPAESTAEGLTAAQTPPAGSQATGQTEVAGGVLIQSGSPSRVPPTRPGAEDPAAATSPQASDPQIEGQATPYEGINPPARQNAAQLTPGAVGIAGLTGIAHPRVRPNGTIAADAAVRQAIAAPLDPQISPLAVASAPAPKRRPGNMSARVARASAAAPSRQAAAVRNAPAVASPVAPTAPSGQTVSARATNDNTINLGRVNLIGVYGSNSNRRALVRLQNGRFVKVGVGERIGGVGRVTAIGNSSIQLDQNGRNTVLEIPS